MATVNRLNEAEAIAKYGHICDGRWERVDEFCAILEIPEGIAANWINSATGRPTTRIYCNKDMHGPLMQALQNAKERELLDELKTFDGAFLIRSVRGCPSVLSWHSYGLAIDINAEENKLGAKPTLSASLVECFEDAGFYWGGRFKRKDGMHFQLAEG